jgi:hypothetical protein
MVKVIRTNKLNNVVKALVATALLSLIAAPAFATHISGKVLSNGLVTTDTGDLENATALTFSSVDVILSTGTFLAAGVTNGTAVTFITNPLKIDPIPVMDLPLWATTGTTDIFLFVLQKLVVTEQTAAVLTLVGHGYFESDQTGKDQTPAMWRMTTQQPGLEGPNETFFSLSTGSETIPEPTTGALMGLGLLGLGWAGRSRRA